MKAAQTPVTKAYRRLLRWKLAYLRAETSLDRDPSKINQSRLLRAAAGCQTAAQALMQAARVMR